MATTTYLGLKKPALTDPALVSDLNDNFDLIDGIIDLIYPVGSIYMSVESTDPATLIPGTTWVRIKDRFLMAAGDTYSAGDTGGAATHTMTTDEMPSHNHTFTGSAVTSGGISANHTHTGTSGTESQGHTHSGPSHYHQIPRSYMGLEGGSLSIIGGTQPAPTESAGTGATGGVSANHTHTLTTGNQSAGHTHSVTASGSIGNAGSGNAFSILPPYLAVYMWKRTA